MTPAYMNHLAPWTPFKQTRVAFDMELKHGSTARYNFFLANNQIEGRLKLFMYISKEQAKLNK